MLSYNSFALLEFTFAFQTFFCFAVVCSTRLLTREDNLLSGFQELF